jgi:hypothetical protein
LFFEEQTVTEELGRKNKQVFDPLVNSKEFEIIFHNLSFHKEHA